MVGFVEPSSAAITLWLIYWSRISTKSGVSILLLLLLSSSSSSSSHCYIFPWLSGTAAFDGLIARSPSDTSMDVFGGMIIGWRKSKYLEKSASLSLCSPQILHQLPRDWTRQLTARSVARMFCLIIDRGSECFSRACSVSHDFSSKQNR